MEWIRKAKHWARRGLIIAAGFLGGFLLGWFCAGQDRDEDDERISGEENEQRIEENAIRDSREAREEVLALPDDDFDKRYPAAGRSAGQGGDRFVDRIREYFYKRRSNGNCTGSDGDSSGGD